MIKNTTNNHCSRHPNSNALTYCGACNKYMCAECKTYHDGFFGGEHEASVVPSERAIEDTEDQYNEKCKAHPEYPLDTMCNDCLCCAKCRWEGEHKGHNTVSVDETRGALKASLESYIPSLERYQATFEEAHQKAKELVKETEDKMRKTAKLTSKYFKSFREAIDEKEKAILERLGNYEAAQNTTNSLINDARDLMREVPTIIEGVKKLLAEWDSKKLTAVTAGKVLAIKRKVESGEKIVGELKRVGDCEVLVETERFLRGVKRGLEEINAVEEVPMKRVLYSAPTGFGTKAVHPVFVSLCWDENEEFDEYVISKREEGGEWSDGKDLIHVDNNEGKKNHFVLYPLKPETEYEFRLMGKKEGMETRWSEAVSVRTGARTVIPEVDNTVRRLKRNMNNTEVCAMLLGNIIKLSSINENHVKALGEAGAIERIVRTIDAHIDEPLVCGTGCEALCSITLNDDNRVIAGKSKAIETIVRAIHEHIKDEDVCENGCCVLWNIAMNDDNKTKASQEGAIKALIKAMRKHKDKERICYYGCGALLSIAVNNVNRKSRVIKESVIETMLYAISRHVSSIDVCNYGCIILWNMSEGNSFIQEKACGKKGGLSFLLDALRKHNGNPNLVESCCGAIDAILSSQKTYTKYCTSNVLDLVRRCSEKYKDNEEIKQILLVLERKEDPRVRDAVSMGVCTKDAFPKCSEECECDENIYCPKCCVQQKAFWCLTCDKGEIEFYCETCIKRDHQGHECEEFFCPVRCGTK